MTTTAITLVDDSCADCDSPKGPLICQACADEQAGDVINDIRSWLLREKTKFPGLTNSEVALIERLIGDLEAP